MGKFARSYRKTMKQLKIAGVLAAVVALSLYQIASSVEAKYLWPILATAVAFFIVKLIYRSFSAPRTYINSHGYVVLSATNELEHRHIAKQILGRGLAPNEVVHHINGRKTDNSVENLCLMDRDKHEHFHSWLSWKKNKSGRYPSFADQIRTLEDEYGGTILNHVTTPKPMDEPVKIKPAAAIRDPMIEKRLFHELRRERKRIAQERNIPVYVIFHNNTLTEMSEKMPDSKHSMLEVKGVGNEKYETYGAYFIQVIRKFKVAFDIDQTG